MEEDPSVTYRKWYWEQSASKRAELDSLGLVPDKFEIPLLKVNGQSCVPLQDELYNKSDDEEQPVEQDLKSQEHVLIHKLLDAFCMFGKKECLLQAECIKIVTGIGNPMPQVKVAKKFGLTRAGLSWRCKKIQTLLGTKPSIYMRSQEVCDTYANLKKPTSFREGSSEPQGKQGRKKQQQ
jgi:hypothetical protein